MILYKSLFHKGLHKGLLTDRPTNRQTTILLELLRAAKNGPNIGGAIPAMPAPMHYGLRREISPPFLVLFRPNALYTNANLKRNPTARNLCVEVSSLQMTEGIQASY